MTWKQLADSSPLDWLVADTALWAFLIIVFGPILLVLIIGWIAMMIYFAKDVWQSLS